MRIDAHLPYSPKRLERAMELRLYYKRMGSLIKAYTQCARDEQTRRATRYNLVRRANQLGVGELLDVFV